MSIQTQTINFPSNNHTTPAYLAQPEGSGPHPALIVLQEWWGLVPHIKEVADRFAAAGFIAVAPDLYHGRSAAEPDEARKLAMALDREQAVREIAAAAVYLKSLASVAPKRVGVVGWCMGGALALSAAAHTADIAATVAFYGRPLAPEDTANIQSPVLGLYGGEDQGIPVTLVEEFKQALQAHHKPHEIHIYPNAGHAFFNETRPEAYHPEAAADAWKRTLAWFREHLRDG
jgi:carboxymethylenebutenolidase